ncbi:MAG: hypothetical protein KF688_02225 [Pirellulales bacterium]|nr:hypothetical protein [Pirellulales bacterium]
MTKLSIRCRGEILGLVLASALFATVAAAPHPAIGADVDARFVEALNKRGWDDTAVAYLDWAAQQPTVSRDFLSLTPYFRATALVAQSRQSVSRSQRDAALQRAAEDLAAFAAARPQAEQAIDALRQLAYLRFDQAQAIGADAEKSRSPTANALAATAARQAYEACGDAARELVDACSRRLADLPKAAAAAVGSEASELRATLTARLAEGRFLVGLAQFESARFETPKSRPATAAIASALKTFRELAEEYRSSTVGFSSQYYQGRCHQLGGDFDKALGAYEAVVGLPTQNPEWRRWQARAHQYRTECLVAVGKYDTAILDAADWLQRAQAGERTRPEWQGVAYELSRARLAKAEELGDKDNEAKRLKTEARSGLTEIIRAAGPMQRPARMLMASLGDRAPKRQEVRTFAEALAAGREAVEQMNSSNLAAKLAEQNNPEAVGELQEQAAEHQQAALEYLQQALGLADRATPIDDVNAARYYLCWLYWEEGQWHDAAVLGSNLARMHPDSQYAAGGAGVALRAFEKLQNAQAAAGEQPSEFLAAELTQLAELIAAKWPQSDDAAAATTMLVAQALRGEDLEAAENLLARLPEASRAAAELSLGASLWAKYCGAAAGPNAAAPETAALRERAETMLQNGFKALGSNHSPTPATAAALLSLAQLRQVAGDARGALDVLENKQFGALALIAARADAAANPRFVEEAYKTALSAYLFVEPPQREQALAMMAALDEANGDGPEARAKLTRLYVGLGVQLQRRLKDLQAAGFADRARTLAGAFEELLKRASEGADSANWQTQLWLAQTSQQLGEGLTGKDAAPYFAQAEAAYRALLAAADKGGADAPPVGELIKFQKLLGDCLRGQGKFDEAMTAYGQVLAERTSQLDVQQAAARTLMEQGIAEGNAGPLERSIHGDQPQAQGTNLVWGWLKLAKTVEGARRLELRTKGADSPRAAQLADVFFDARYNAARARLEAAMLAAGDERAKQLATVRQSVEAMKNLYPDLGGTKWNAAFAELAKEAAGK